MITLNGNADTKGLIEEDFPRQIWEISQEEL